MAELPGKYQHDVLHNTAVLDATCTIVEMEQHYTSGMEDEDELNFRIQQMSTNSPCQVAMDKFILSPTQNKSVQQKRRSYRINTSEIYNVESLQDEDIMAADDISLYCNMSDDDEDKSSTLNLIKNALKNAKRQLSVRRNVPKNVEKGSPILKPSKPNLTSIKAKSQNMNKTHAVQSMVAQTSISDQIQKSSTNKKMNGDGIYDDETEYIQKNELFSPPTLPTQQMPTQQMPAIQQICDIQSVQQNRRRTLERHSVRSMIRSRSQEAKLRSASNAQPPKMKNYVSADGGKRQKNDVFKYKHRDETSIINDKSNDDDDDEKEEDLDKKCKYRIKNEIFELYSYYKPIRLLGSGGYGVVCEAIDERTKKRVAIKKNKNFFDEIHDAQRILREIKLLLHFTKYKHPDIIELYDCICPSHSEIQDFGDIYIAMPLFESNLHRIISSKQAILNEHFQYITYQILRGLKFVHECGVIHRDIKPENILVNGGDCNVKIIDFGLSRGVLDCTMKNNNNLDKKTEYICTRWYRAPEIMCNGGIYDSKIDIWGVGCILAELILRKPLFPGINYLDQLQKIFYMMGIPNNLDWICNEYALSWIQKLPKYKAKNLKQMISYKFNAEDKNDFIHCIDLLYKLLTLNPSHRISADQCLNHPYFIDLHCETDTDQLIGKPFDLTFEFQQSIKTKFGIRHLLYDTLNKYHKKKWGKIKKTKL